MLTRCDTTSKICSKTHLVENLVAFGKTPINVDIIIAAEYFSVKCIDGKTSYESFDKLRIEYYL